MFTVLTVLFTLAVLAGIYWIYSTSEKKGLTQKWYIWVLYALWSSLFAVGFSFVLLNIYGGHTKAASTGFFLFFIPLIIFAVLILRAAGLFSLGKAKGASL